MPSEHAPRASAFGPRAMATRNLLLDHAQELVAREGVDALSTENLAVKAGVSVGTVYRYWRNKHEILREVQPELAGLVEKVRQLQAVAADDGLPSDEKWQRTRLIFSLE